MYNGIGLNTARGSGTSGYIQKNLSTVRRTKRQHEKDDPERDIQRLEASLARPPNKEILDHRRRREIEVKCLEKREKLEDEGFTEDIIEEQLSNYRKELMEKAAAAANVKEHKIHLHQHRSTENRDTHSMAEMSRSRNERLKSAFGIGDDAEKGKSNTSSKDSRNPPQDAPSPDETTGPPIPAPVEETPGVHEPIAPPEPPVEASDASKIYKLLKDSDSDDDTPAEAPKKNLSSRKSSRSPENVPKRYRISSEKAESRRRRPKSSPSSASSSDSDSDSTSSSSPVKHRDSRRRVESKRKRSLSGSRSRSRDRSRNRSRNRGSNRSRNRGRSRSRSESRSRSHSPSRHRETHKHRSHSRRHRSSSRDRSHRSRRRSHNRDHRSPSENGHRKSRHH